MEQIMITKPDGSMVPMVRKSKATAIKSAKQTWELIGNDVVNINVESPFPQTYHIGDKITVFGRPLPPSPPERYRHFRGCRAA